MVTEKDPDLDVIDRTILGSLQADGRISVKHLAARIGLSTSATSERVRRLENSGAILGYHAEIAPRVLARPVDAVVGVKAQPDFDRPAVEAWIHQQPAVVEAVHLTGPHDYMLRFRCATASELDDILMAMKDAGGIAETETKIVLRSLPVTPTPL